MEMKVADAIVKCLEAEGIEYAFGITGYHYLALFNSLEKSSIKIISVKHENAAGLSALQYAKLAQKPALVLGTAGPGATNLVTGIAEIYKSNLPCFILTPVVPTTVQGKNSCQEDSGDGNSYSISGIMRHITKKTTTCSDPFNVAAYIHDLFRHCLYGRKGPVHLLVPVNHFEQTIPFNTYKRAQYRHYDDCTTEPDKISAVADELKSSKNPLILAGQRAWYPTISGSLHALSEKFHVPVILSAGAKGLFDENSPLFGGILDLYGHRSAELFAKKSDLVISIGEDFGEFTTMKYDPDLFPRKLIQIDIDGYDIGRNYPVELSLCGNLVKTINSLSAQMESRNIRRFYDSASFHKKFIAENTLLFEEAGNTALPLKPQLILKEISDLAPPDAFFLADIGKIGLFTFRYLKVRSDSYSTCPANYTMAQAVAGAVGAKLAAPEKTVIVLCGDGAFMMNCMEIATSIQYDAPVIWVVFADSSYGNVDWAQKMLYTEPVSFTNLSLPDLSKLAEAFSIGYYKITDLDSLRSNILSSIKFYKERKRSVIVEVLFDTDESLPVKPRLVKFIQDSRSKSDFKPSSYFMKSLKRMLREKV